MKFKLLIILSVILIILEESINFSHPIHVVVPTDYFSETQQQQFLLLIFLVLGTGYPLLSLLLSSTIRQWSFKQCMLLIIIGSVDRFFINSHGMILCLGIAVIIAKTLIDSRYSEYLIGTVLTALGIMCLGIPLLMSSFFSETFMDVATFQHLIQLYQSNNYFDYVKENLLTSSLENLGMMIFVFLPFLLMGERISQWVGRYRWGSLLCASLLFAIGTMIKALSRFTESSLAFDMIILIGGACQAVGIFILAALVIRKYTIDGLVVMTTLLIADLAMLLFYTGIGVGDYKTMLLDDVLLRSFIVIIISAISMFILSYFRKSAVNT
ncbi:hypothetical protein [Macrococcus lamae]|uniref:Uncharacterized protein n=1 Tax=Macrococcus lamae TaxID=198484 RepID=A0A4R6BW40_9STAP|nr:hypothetical protein [Macrococcus lamae]TDM12510.1 hypothetical protein ERX29_02560 [Macrococcus lamae]